ncbi:hypothetical protein [Bradyrhizobium elkanii]
MNMQYRKGQIVGYVEASGRLSVPAMPESWRVLQVMPGRDAKVIKAFARALHQRLVADRCTFR